MNTPLYQSESSPPPEDGSSAEPGACPRLRPQFRPQFRRCVVSRERRPRTELLRLVVDPEHNRLVFDLKETLPGRGLWVEAHNIEKLNTAMIRTARGRSGRHRNISIPEGFRLSVEKQIAEHVLSLLSLARRAGEIVCGFEKTRIRLKAGQTELLLHAEGASRQSLEKLTPFIADKEDAIFSLWCEEELGAVFGRERVVFAAVSAGGLARLLRIQMRKLRGVR